MSCSVLEVLFQMTACKYLAGILISPGRCCFVCEVGLLLPHLGHHSRLHPSSGLLMWQAEAEGKAGGGKGGDGKGGGGGLKPEHKL